VDENVNRSLRVQLLHGNPRYALALINPDYRDCTLRKIMDKRLLNPRES